jgi:hypothetical protein
LLHTASDQHVWSADQELWAKTKGFFFSFLLQYWSLNWKLYPCWEGALTLEHDSSNFRCSCISDKCEGMSSTYAFCIAIRDMRQYAKLVVWDELVSNWNPSNLHLPSS